MGRLGAVASVGMEKVVQTASRSAEESVDVSDRAGHALRIKRLEPDETTPLEPEERCAHPGANELSFGHGDSHDIPGLFADLLPNILAYAKDMAGRSHARQTAVKRSADFIGKRSVAAGFFDHGVVSMGVPRPLCHAVTPSGRNARPANPAGPEKRVREWLR